MTRTTFTCCALALAAAMALAIPAEAASKKKSFNNGAETPGMSMAPLTASECERLGGEVYSNADCKGTGKSCFVSTRKNGDHWVCIDEAG